MKIISVKFSSSQQFIEGVGAARSQIKIGDACDNAWGGGKIVSLEHDVLTGSLHIRKGARYVRTLAEESNNKPTFDVAMVPWGNVACACGVEDEADDSSAKPSREEFLADLIKLRGETLQMLADQIKASVASIQSTQDAPAKQVQQNNQGQQRR